MLTCGVIDELETVCPLPMHSRVWDGWYEYTEAERIQIIRMRKIICEKCENNPAKHKSETVSETVEPVVTEPIVQVPTSELPVTKDEVERIAELMPKCIACDKAKFQTCEKQPDAAGWIPRTLRLAFTRAEYIHGVQNLTCDDKPGCCALSKAMKDLECEKWKGINNGNK